MSANWRAVGFAAAFYLLLGANLPYLPVWLERARGLSGTEISLIFAAGTLLRIFLGPLVGAQSEQKGLKRTLFQLSVILVLAHGLVVPEGPTILLAMVIGAAAVFGGVIIPLSETLLLAGTKRGWPDYGLARAIGSMAFIATNLVLGFLIARYGAEIVIWWLLFASILLAGMSLIQPAELGASRQAQAAGANLQTSLNEGFGLYASNPRILMAGLASSFIQAAHAYYYNLGSNVWLGQGIAEAHLGSLWSIGVALEVLLLIVSGWLFRSWSAGAIMLLGGLGAMLRWTIIGFAPSIGVLYLAQAMHALSFAATHIGYMQFLRSEVAPEKVGVVISISSAVGYGPMLAILGIIAGYWYDTFPSAQAQGFWIMAASAFAGCLCILPILRSQPQSAAVGG
ncbi:MAG: MFS transporter [Pseudomonadota bacterium]